MSTPERPARAPRQATVAYLWVSTWTCAPWPLRLTLMADVGAPAIAHRARLSMPPSSPPPSRYHPLPAGCVCAAAGFLEPMPTRLRVRARVAGVRSPHADPGADCPAALEASELRAARYIRGLRTTIIWGTMGVRHGAHTDTRAKCEQRPTQLLSCFEIR